MAIKRGLPEKALMRHDSHYVEELTKRSGRSIGTILPISMIEANPDQPRTNLGNIEELAASIREKGVLEPILVRAIGPNRYQIISGERRFRAATLAGLDEIPAIELDVDDKEQLEIALIENIQRKDLTPFEEAEGFLALQQKFNYTHEKISQVIGKSRTTVTETLMINEIVRAYASGEMSRETIRKQTATRPESKAGRPKNYVFEVKDKSLPFSLNLTFKKSNVDRS